jgi:hypothetical protein
MLTPQEIHRMRDLIALGPLSAVRADVGLVQAKLARVYWPNFHEDPNFNHRETNAIRLKNALEANVERVNIGYPPRPVIVEPAPKARELFYNKQGGVKGEHWAESGMTFAEYVKLEEGPCTKAIATTPSDTPTPTEPGPPSDGTDGTGLSANTVAASTAT